MPDDPPLAGPVPGKSSARYPPGPVLLRLALFGALWAVLSGGSYTGWYLALPIIAGSTWASLQALPAGAWRLRSAGILRFVPFFVGASLRSGWDVAGRALRPRPRLDPVRSTLRLRLPPGPPRYFLAAVVGLFPGTLTTALEGDVLHLHVLDTSAVPEAQLRELEARVADLFGVPLEEAGSSARDTP